MFVSVVPSPPPPTPQAHTDSIGLHATMGNWFKDQTHSFVWIISTAIV